MRYNYSYFRALPQEYDTLMIVLSIVFMILSLIALWKIFEKAGVEGWKCLIPIYNVYIEFKIATGNGWMFLLLFVPFVNFVVLIWYYLKLAKVFGKSEAFAVGLIFLNVFFILILGFGEDKYIGVKEE